MPTTTPWPKVLSTLEMAPLLLALLLLPAFHSDFPEFVGHTRKIMQRLTARKIQAGSMACTMASHDDRPALRLDRIGGDVGRIKARPEDSPAPGQRHAAHG